MKKTIATICAAALSLQTVNLAAAAAEAEPEKLLAGVGGISVIFADESTAKKITAENVALTTGAGSAVGFSLDTTGRTVNIVPTSALAANDADTEEEDRAKYRLTVGDYSAELDIETVWRADFSSEESMKSSLYEMKSENATFKVENNTLIMNEKNSKDNGKTAVFPKYAGQTSEENLSFNFDVSYDADAASYPLAVSFNAQDTDKKTFNITDNRTTSASWVKKYNEKKSKSLCRGYIIHDGELTIAGGQNDNKSSTECGTKVEAKVSSPAATNRSYSVSVNKLGDEGVLFINNQLADVYQTSEFVREHLPEDYTAEQKAAMAGYNMPTKGYFAVTQLRYANDAGECTYSNMSITKSSVRELITADLVIEGDAAGDEDQIVLKFNEKLTYVTNTAEKVTVSAGGANVDFTWTTDKDDATKLIIKPVGGVTPNTDYKIDVAAGFGEGNMTAKELLTKTFRLNYEEGDITIEKISADSGHVYITLSEGTEMSKIANIEKTVRLSLNGDKLDYTAKIQGNTIVLTTSALMTQDTIYDLDISKKLGYEAVTVGSDMHKYFMLKTFAALDFSDGAEVSDFGSFSTLTNNASTNGNDLAKTAFCGGKLYVTKKSYSTLSLNKMGLSDHENYILSFDIQHYGSNNLILMFNMNSPSTTGGIYAYSGNTNLTGFGWYTSGSKGENQYRDFVSGTQKSAELYPADSNIHVAPTAPVSESYADVVTVETVDGKTVMTPPDTDAKVYHYTLVKEGTKGTLYIDGKPVDEYETAGEYAKFNKLYPEKEITRTVPKTGYVVLGGNHGESDKKFPDNAYALSNVTAAAYAEYVGDKVAIVEKTESISGKTADGTLKVRNYFDADKAARIVVSAYGANNRLLAAKQVINTTLSGGELKKASYNISADESIVRIETELILQDTVGQKGGAAISEAKNVDYDNGIIQIKGTVSDKSKALYIALSNDKSFGESFTELKTGHFAKITDFGENGEFEYEFKYTDSADSYTMGIYALENDSGKIKARAIGEYNYASTTKCNEFVDTAKGTKVSFEELAKCAQTIGADVSYADDENKQNILTEAIYAEKNTITDRTDIVRIATREKNRMEFILGIKNTVSTAADVNSMLEKYAAEIGLDLTAYGKIGNNKITVATGFIRADYETKGFAQFKTDFDAAVAKFTGGGGGGGSTSGGTSYAGGGGGTSYITNEINSMLTADKAEQTNREKFSDLGGSEWAREAIESLSGKGIINGVSENSFAPASLVTREQFVKMAVSAFGLLNDSAEAELSDVQKDAWSYKYIASAMENAVITGTGEGIFSPSANITRQDMAVILYRIMLLKGRNTESAGAGFADTSEIAEYARRAVEEMSAAGFINGFSDGSFRPRDNATRAQAAKVIYEMMKEMN